MSRARDEIVDAILDNVGGLTDDELDRLADRIMVVVRETVARGFERAAAELEETHARYCTAKDKLRGWAVDARMDDRPSVGHRGQHDGVSYADDPDPLLP